MKLTPSWNLYWRLFTASILPMLVNFIFILFLLWFFLGYPLIKTSVKDFANLIIDSIELRQQLDKSEKVLFSKKIMNERKIEIKESRLRPIGSSSWLPYVVELEIQLSHKLNQKVSFVVTNQLGTNPKKWYRALLDYKGSSYLISFPRNRLPTRPPVVFIIIVAFGLIVSTVSSFLMAQYLCRIFSPLLNAADKLGQETLPKKLPIKGVNEIKLLALRIDKMASEVQQLLANRTTLLVGISHNLRNPIARLRLALELLPQNTEPKLVAKMTRALNEMNDTITEFMTLSKGMDVEDTKVVDLNDIIKAVIANYSHDIADIQFEYQQESIIEIQSSALKQVLSNLLENAIHYGLGKPIKISLHYKRDDMVVQIDDNGAGIPPEMLVDIFQPFVKFNYQDQSVPKGTGVGLAIVQLICNSYNWGIALENNSKGGLSAKLTLPIETL